MRKQLCKLRLTLEQQRPPIAMLEPDRDTNQEGTWDHETTIKEIQNRLRH